MARGAEQMGLGVQVGVGKEDWEKRVSSSELSPSYNVKFPLPPLWLSSGHVENATKHPSGSPAPGLQLLVGEPAGHVSALHICHRQWLLGRHLADAC